jgi:hypothetical protein
MEDVPFSAGLQILYTASIASGDERQWINDREKKLVDSLTKIEEAMKNADIQIRCDPAERDFN